MKIFVLLDVDETAAVSNMHFGVHDGGYRYNETLLQALKQHHLYDIYLFTSYTLSGIAKNIDEESTTAASRLKLIRYLESQGFRVHGVITMMDAEYNQGVGAYYEQVIRPYETLVLDGKNLRDEKSGKEYKEACEKERELRTRAEKAQLTGKGAIYNYTVERLQTSLLYPIFSFIFFDDRQVYLDDVQNHNKRFSYPLCTIQAKPHHNVEIYSEQIAKFLKENMERVFQSIKEKVVTASKDSKASAEKSAIAFHSPFQDESRDILIEELMTLGDDIPGSSKVPIYGLRMGTGSSVIRYLPLAIARKILSQDSEGRDIRVNSLGNNLVVKHNNIFFKRPLTHPLTEQAVYQMSRLLGGGIVAPTQVLLLKMPEGTVEVQASLAVPGIGLEDFLRIPQALLGLQKVLEEDDFFAVLGSILRGEYYQTWLKKQQDFNPELPSEAQCTLLLDVLYKLPKHCWPLELIDGNPTRAKVEITLLENKGFRNKALFSLIALIETYPQLCEGSYVGDLLYLPKIFEILRDLYPDCTPKEIFEAGIHILEKLDPKNLGKHAGLAYLTEPGDHKADNFIVLIERNSTGRLLKCKIVAIDNDDAMQGVLRGSKTHSMNVNSIIYRLINDVPLDASLREAWQSIKPEVFVLEWLGSLVDYFRTYAELKQARILFPALHDSLNLEKQIPVGFVARLIWRIKNIQSILDKTVDVSLVTLLRRAAPLLFAYYETLGARFKDPFAFFMKLYERGEDITLESVLEKSPERKILEDVGYINALKQVPGFKTYEENITALIELYGLLSSHVHQSRTLWMLMYLQNQGLNAGFKDKLGEITLTTKTAAELYSIMPRGFIALLKACPKMCFQFENPNIKHSLQHPELLFFALASEDRIILTEALLAYGQNRNTVRAIDKSTPLHLAAAFYPDCLQILLPGAELECLDVYLKTPLDLAIEYRQTTAIETLLNAGAGRKLLIWNGLHFIHQNRISNPEFCQDLLNRNQALAWEMTLNLVAQTEKSSENVYLESREGRRYLSSNVYRQIFGCHLYVMSEPKLPLTRNAIVLVRRDASQYTAYFVKDKKWVKQGEDSLKSLELSPPALRVSDDSGLVVINEEVRQFVKSTLGKARLSFVDGFPKDNLYGCRSVTSVSCQIAPGITLGLHLKENPELPAREFLVHSLAKNLFGFITPPLALWRFSKEHTSFWRSTTIKGYPVLATQTIKGITLAEAFLRHPEMIRDLDLESVSAAAILAMLCNPEDGRPDNYMVEIFSKGREANGKNIVGYRIVSIDNDHTLVTPIALNRDGQEETHPRSLQVKTILYCLDQMSGPVHQKVREQILKIKPYEFLRSCLEELIEEEKNIKALFNDRERQELESNNVLLEFCFKPSRVLDIYQKLCRLQAVLGKKPEILMLDLLRQVIPGLGIRYQNAYHQFETPMERFKFLTRGCFKEQRVETKSGVEIHEVSMATSRDILEMSRDLAAEERKLQEEEPTSLEVVIQKLQEAHALQSKLRSIYDELLEGNTDRFLRLPLSDYQERIINGQGAELPGFDFDNILFGYELEFPGLNFDKILSALEFGKDLGGLAVLKGPLKDQRGITNILDYVKTRKKIVFEAMHKVQFRKLRILNYEDLTDDMLEKFLRTQKNLLALEMSGCPKLTNRIGLIINMYCKALDKLSLKRLPLFTFGWPMADNIERIYLPSERVRVYVLLDNIKTLKIQYCPNLGEYHHPGRQLSRVEFIDCTQLSKFSILNPKQLKRLRLKKCQVKNSDFYEKYPCLLEVDFGDMSPDCLRLLDEKLLEVFGRDPGSIPESVINTIRKMFHDRKESLQMIHRKTEQILNKILPLIRKDLATGMHIIQILEKLLYSPENLKSTVDDLVRCLEITNSFRHNVAQLHCTLSTNPETLIASLEPTIVDKIKLMFLKEDSALDLEQIDLWTCRVARLLCKLSPNSETVKIAFKFLFELLKKQKEDSDPLSIFEIPEIIAKLPHTLETIRHIVTALLPSLSLNKDLPFLEIIQASIALSRLPPLPDTLKPIVDALLPLLVNKDAELRKFGALAFSNFSYKEGWRLDVQQALLLLLEDENLEVRERAAITLVKVSLEPAIVERAMDVLMALLVNIQPCAASLLSLEDESLDAGEKLAEALVQISLDPEIVKLEILTLLGDSDRIAGLKSGQALQEMSLTTENCIRTIELLDELRHTPETAKSVIDFFFLCLKQEESSFKVFAVRKLGYLPDHPMVEPVLDSLLTLLNDNNKSLIEATLLALKKLPRKTQYLKKITETLIALLENERYLENQSYSKVENIAIKRRFVEALGEMCPKKFLQQALEVSKWMLRTENPDVMVSTVSAVEKLPHTPETAESVAIILLYYLEYDLKTKDGMKVIQAITQTLSKLPLYPKTLGEILDRLAKFYKRREDKRFDTKFSYGIELDEVESFTTLNELLKEERFMLCLTSWIDQEWSRDHGVEMSEQKIKAEVDQSPGFAEKDSGVFQSAADPKGQAKELVFSRKPVSAADSAKTTVSPTTSSATSTSSASSSQSMSGQTVKPEKPKRVVFE